MIKSTFYNLPEEKRLRIINAVILEFSGAESDKISINRIIKTANISRGSFYQYFDDKVDLVEVVIKSYLELMIDRAFEAISVSRGDIFYVFEQFFEIFAEISETDEKRTVLKNLIKNMHTNDTLISEYLMTRFKGFDSIKEMIRHLSRERLRFSSDEGIDLLYQILAGVLKNALFKLFVREDDCGEVREKYLKKLEIVKRGAEK